MMTRKKKKQPTAEELCEEQRQLAWAQLGQLMHLVSMPNYPPKPPNCPPKLPNTKEEGQTED
jgi:hypothetical protein